MNSTHNPRHSQAESSSPPTLVFASPLDRFDDWKQALGQAMPELNVVRHGDDIDPHSVRYALVWKPETGFFEKYPELEMVINLGAGVDALVGRQDLPAIPITRLVDPDMSQMMAGFVLFAVMRYARHIHLHEQYQRLGQWHYIHPKNPEDVRVTVLGLGELGTRAATEIARQGFDVWGWSRSEKSVKGVTCRHGLETLQTVLGRSDILVILMPLTSETHHLLNAQRLDQLPQGCCLINVARGQIIDETALTERLQSGQIGHATLDVFEKEPLSPDSPLWKMDNVLITPHLASVALPRSAARQIALNIRRVQQNQPPLHQIEVGRGY